jgi:hypothetical protein
MVQMEYLMWLIKLYNDMCHDNKCSRIKCQKDYAYNILVQVFNGSICVSITYQHCDNNIVNEQKINILHETNLAAQLCGSPC